MKLQSRNANKADVKAMMARFQAGGVSSDESSFTPPGRIKQPLNPTLSFGPTIPTKKPVQETFSGGSINTPPKPSYLKNTASNKSDSEVNDPNAAKALASRFASTQDDSNSNRKPFAVNKQQPTLKPSTEASPLQQAPLNSTLSDPKPTYPKPPPIQLQAQLGERRQRWRFTTKTDQQH
ncbi:hypothetical protein F7725_015468 [Dissostichus mawsoni]|uniref:Uncharacterized protein n=1 Tax=Dissostichus mawsoni TaxID=36200 RepID=A0A7J5YJ03_DISMA|nr:hypothetical protein F7725_015468 [Dissostichus mawsoni]